MINEIKKDKGHHMGNNIFLNQSLWEREIGMPMVVIHSEPNQCTCQEPKVQMRDPYFEIIGESNS